MKIRTSGTILQRYWVKTSLIALILLMVLFVGTVSADTKTLTITPITQEHSGWCVPASLKMMIDYYGSPSKTQQQIANDMGMTNSSPSVTNPIWEAYADNYLNFGTPENNSIYPGESEFYLVKSEINDNKPLILLDYYIDGNNQFQAHALVVKGYDDPAGILNDCIRVNDPWTGTSFWAQWLPEEEILYNGSAYMRDIIVVMPHS